MMEVDGELSDPDHPAGVTQQGFDQILDALMPFGHDITVSRADRYHPDSFRFESYDGALSTVADQQAQAERLGRTAAAPLDSDLLPPIV